MDPIDALTESCVSCAYAQKQSVETIREAAMRGHVDRVRELLDGGFSADAESVRCESWWWWFAAEVRVAS